MDTTIADPLVGRLLDGRYLIKARVARGGMASVYRATDERLDRTVAVKVMQPVLAESEDFVRRFIREAQSAARLSHPNVVNVFDQGRDGDIVFLVMEYVEGRNLRDVLRAAGRLTPGQAVGVLEPIVSAVAAAHRAGIVHRDMKPENVLMAADGRIKVADFGLARAIESSSITMTQGTLIGSPAYLAPEQIERGVADQRADIYAIGVMAFELLTGRPPYSGDVAMAIAMQHVRDDIPAPSTLVSVPPALDTLVVAATRRDPDLRPVDGSAMLARLHEAQRSVPIEPLDAYGPLIPDHNDTVVLPAVGRLPAAGVPAGPPVAPDVDTETRERPRRRWRKGWIWFAVVVLLAAGAASYGAYLASHRGTTGTVSPGPSAAAKIAVPQLKDLTLNAARLAAPDLQITKTAEESSTTVSVGLILRQDPPAGTELNKGDSVTVVVSSGPAIVKVPDVAGLGLTDAEAALTKEHLVLSPTRTSEYSRDVKAGLVIRTTPKKGASAKEGDPVSVVMSKGPELVTVIDERSKAEAEAVKALKDLGFVVKVTRAYSDTVAEGLVAQQEPFGNQAPKGDTIAITVSQGPQYFTLNDYRGMNVNTVKAALEKLQLKVNISKPFPGGPNEIVIQNPGKGAKVKHGDTVSFVVF
ncbi:MAG: serine/threonine protein kinase [Frankiales bacterium]|nr:serine/threonine protein kinase [Frankiales bacterium]